MKKIKSPTSFINCSSTIMIICVGFILFLTCQRGKEETENLSTDFQLTSPVIAEDNMLPADYTCDGQSVTLPVQWSGAPENTQYFALIMHHIASPADIHWYWVLYNIPATVTGLARNAKGIGTLGTNSVNDRCEYAPPCSQGPGRKDYVITIYALSGFIVPSVPESEVNREALLNAMDGKIISSTSITVWYSRNVK